MSTLSFLTLIWLITLLICLLQGTESITLREAFWIIWNNLASGRGVEVDGSKGVILLEIRLPRLLLAGMVGGTLAMVGVTLQALLRNPLADPFVIGVSSGTALGAIFAILSGLNLSLLGFTATPLFGFLGGLMTLLFLYRLSQVHGKILVQTLLLGGVILNAMISAVIMFITYMVDPNKIVGVLYWLMGNLGSVEIGALGIVALYLLIGMGILLGLARGLNLLALGEETALSLGLESERTKRMAFFATALLTGAVVSVSGLISFVGIMIPHVLRILIGPDHRLLLPASLLGGGIFLMAADTVARSLISPTEIPVGVITALCGGPFFLYLLKRGRMRFFNP
jgi:iron complex transport system permease protein